MNLISKDNFQKITDQNKIVYLCNFNNLLISVSPEDLDDYKDFDAALLSGEADILRKKNSEVRIDVPEGMEDILWRKINTNFSKIHKVIPSEERIIGPTVEVQLKKDQKIGDKETQFIIRIPHRLQGEEEMSAVKVRCVDLKKENGIRVLKNKKVAEGKIPYFEIDSRHVIIHTNHFSEYICSSCSEQCLTSIMVFPFGSLTKNEDITDVNVVVYLCGSLYDIQDFKDSE